VNPAGRARAALFDLDGTLLDTAPDFVVAINRLLVEESRAPLGLATIRPQVSNGAIAVVRTAFPDVPVNSVAFDELRARFLAHYSSALSVHTQLFPGFEAVLATLEAHALPWGIITNKAAWLTEPLLAALGLHARAACVMSGDTFPERKPHPRPLLMAAEHIAVAPADCVYVGDALRDVQAARAAGMVPLGVRFGYLDAAQDPDSWPVAGWLEEPRQLLSWLELPVMGRA
jgi:N-acetyl-D-muramate 6-phosphate phosphatase